MRVFALLVFFSLVYVPSSLFGQDEAAAEKKRKAPYFNYVQSGILIGKKGYGTTASFSTVHGIRLQRMAFGLGVGYDDFTRSSIDDMGYGVRSYVRWKSVPFFAAVSYDLYKSDSRAIFLQLNAGHSVIRSGINREYNYQKDIEGGLMINPSVGYRIISGKYAIYIGAGYKVQRNAYSYHPHYWIWGYPSTQINVRETMERMEVHLAFGWH